MAFQGRLIDLKQKLFFRVTWRKKQNEKPQITRNNERKDEDEEKRKLKYDRKERQKIKQQVNKEIEKKKKFDKKEEIEGIKKERLEIKLTRRLISRGT